MKQKSTFTIYLKALFLLIFNNRFIDDCAYCDFQKELETNNQLRDSSVEQQNKMEQNIKENTIDLRRELREKLFKSFLYILSAIVIGLIFAFITGAISILDIKKPKIIFPIVSVLCFAWATLGKIGWKTWAGDTVFEDLDKIIFRLLYWIGALLATFSVVL